MQWTIQGRDVNDFVKYEKSEHVCPFGMGLRRCPGEQLAMKELFVFVIVLVQRFRFGQDGECGESQLLLGWRMGITAILPDADLYLSFAVDQYSLL